MDTYFEHLQCEFRVRLNFKFHNFVIGLSNIRAFPTNISSVDRSRYPMFLMILLIVLMFVVTQVELIFKSGS
jgi:hypothetical protein